MKLSFWYLSCKHFPEITHQYILFALLFIFWNEITPQIVFKNQNNGKRRNVKHSKIIQTMMEYRHCVCVPPRAGGRASRTPRPGEARAKRGSPNLTEYLCYGRETPELNSPRTNFLFQDSYLSNTSRKFIFTRPVTS